MKPFAFINTLAALSTLTAASLASLLPLHAAEPTTTPTTAPTTGPAADKAALQDKSQVRGFSIQLYDVTPAGTEKYIKAVDELADLGCTWVNFSVAARQEDVHSEAVIMSYDYMPLPRELERIIRRAKERGMSVMLMPIVLLKNSGSKDWRGVIKPASWDTWFAGYQSYIVEMARLAERFHVNIFCVGSELLSTEPLRKQWVGTIAEIRNAYHGKLAYSANWDHYDPAQGGPTFWDQVDYIGMNNYNELAAKGETNVPVPKLNEAWKPIKDKILAFADKQKKPFFFTEVGWHNLDNTINEPWNYVAKDGKLDNDPQRRAFQSFVETWQHVPQKQFIGIFIWEWCPNGDGTKDWGTYSLQNTPALNDVIKKWFAAPQPPAN